MTHPVLSYPVAHREGTPNTKRSYVGEGLPDFRTFVGEMDHAMNDAALAKPATAYKNPHRGFERVSERRVCRRLLALLDRQSHERVAAALGQLQAELADVCSNPAAHEPTCRLGLALSHIATGNHAEAKQLLVELSDIGLDDVFIARHVAFALSNMGHIRIARDIGIQVRSRLDDDPDALLDILRVFENCLDFPAASTTAMRCLKLIERSGDIDVVDCLKSKLALYRDIASRAKEWNIQSDALLSMAEFGIDTLRAMGRTIYRIELVGDFECTVGLDFEVDASRSTSWNDTLALAFALNERSDDPVESDLIPLTVRSLRGRIRRPSPVPRTGKFRQESGHTLPEHLIRVDTSLIRHARPAQTA